MKKVFSVMLPLLMILFISTGQAAAQPPQPPSPEEMAKFETDWMKSKLNLTSAQLPKVDAINLKYAKKIGEMFKQGPPGDFSEVQKKMTEMESQKRAELQAVLTPAQLKTYDKEVADRRANMQGPPM
jgi:hypothetical protein